MSQKLISPSTGVTRRRLLIASGLGSLFVSAPTIAKVTSPVMAKLDKQINLNHLHTTESIGVVYAQGERYVDPALTQLNQFLRDHYTQEVGVMDPKLYDILFDIRVLLGVREPYEIISGYRSPFTNERLRTTRGGGVAKKSLHMEGRAVDMRLPDVPLEELRDAAISLERGGVGFYPKDKFVHVDTGAFRIW